MKVSVIVAIYNVEVFLSRCIESIINQTYKDIEIILINDGSKDHCTEICNDYMRKDSRIKVINQTNSGVSVARNKGIETASGEYIVFVDGDDFLENNCIEVLYNAIEESASDLVVGSFNKYINDQKFFQGSKESKEFTRSFNLSQCKFDILNYTLEEIYIDELYKVKANFSSPWAKIFKKSIMHKYSLKYVVGQVRAQDEVFNVNYIDHCEKITYINKPVYNYVINSNSTCQKLKKSNNIEKDLCIYNKWRNEIKKFIVDNQYEKEMGISYALLIDEQLCAILAANSSESLSSKISVIKNYILNDELYNSIYIVKPYKKLPIKKELKFQLLKHKLFGLYVFIIMLYYRK